MQNVRPKKSLGQHFLTDNNIAKKISDSLKNEKGLPVIELGAGTGMLTKFVSERFQKLHIVEIDKEAIQFLEENFSDKIIEIVHGDFIRMPIENEFPLPACLIGNFPYNISSQIFFKLLDYKDMIPETVGMIQHEVAERIAAPHGSKTFGILSVLLQTWFHIEYLFSVPPQVFNPPPKVKSAVIRLTRNERTSIACDYKPYKFIVKTAFNQRRKTLRNALKSLPYDFSQVDTELLGKRAEQLSVQDFINLAELLESQNIRH